MEIIATFVSETVCKTSDETDTDSKGRTADGHFLGKWADVYQGFDKPFTGA